MDMSFIYITYKYMNKKQQQQQLQFKLSLYTGKVLGFNAIFHLSVSIQVIESYFNLWSKFWFSLIHSYCTNFFKIIDRSQGVQA